MSRYDYTGDSRDPGFPRVSGDEPSYVCEMYRVLPFSPRERG